VGKYSGPFEYMTINEGMCYVAFPEDAHMPGRHLDVPNDFVKVVVKLKVR
jgi:beta-galactosidase beta subunit